MTRWPWWRSSSASCSGRWAFTWLWPLGIYLGHASCQEAVLAGRKRSALALAGMTVGYAAVSVISLLFVSGLVGFATGNGG